MNKTERGFIPLPDIQHPKLNVQFALPDYVDAEGLGLNVRKVEKIMRIAGIASLRIAGSSGDTTEYMPTVVGHSSTGTAFAGKLGAVKKEALQSEKTVAEDGLCYLHGFNWSDATIDLNVSEISQDMIQDDKNLRSVQDWAPHLNKAIKQGLINISFDHLNSGTYTEGLVLAGIMNLVNIGMFAYDGAFSSPTSTIAAMAAYGFTWNFLIPPFEKLRTKIQSAICESDHGKFRRSLFGGLPQIDRAMAAQATTKLSTLVKPVTPN